MGALDGRVAIITGAGRGIGREHALLFAAEGARVVVNDLGGGPDGSGADATPAEQVVDEIRQAGGAAIANHDDVSDADGAARIVQSAIDEFGTLHVLVNNAGILRDRMVFSMSDEEWDAVVRVHLRGHFMPTRAAARYWRDLAKAGTPVASSIINTTSTSGLMSNPGQTNYGAAKAGIASFTIIASKELERYGVRANAIAPGALTRMTENLGMGARAADRKPEEFDTMAPENIAPLVVWLGSGLSAGISGRVFNVAGGQISVAEGWHRGPGTDKGDRWDPAELTEVVQKLVAEAAPLPGVFG
jgi:NAD(P)-dependent dehydrogenase (short-subunit alcohol dehydrogenase family)